MGQNNSLLGLMHAKPLIIFLKVLFLGFRPKVQVLFLKKWVVARSPNWGVLNCLVGEKLERERREINDVSS